MHADKWGSADETKKSETRAGQGRKQKLKRPPHSRSPPPLDRRRKAKKHVSVAERARELNSWEETAIPMTKIASMRYVQPEGKGDPFRRRKRQGKTARAPSIAAAAARRRRPSSSSIGALPNFRCQFVASFSLRFAKNWARPTRCDVISTF